MARPSKLSPENRARLAEVARLRMQTPSNKELANECHCSERTVEFYISEFMRELAVPRGTQSEKMSFSKLLEDTDATRQSATAECR
jgi:DNA-binding NarL/FixJ family response regulator